MQMNNNTNLMKIMFLLFMIFFTGFFGVTGSAIAGGGNDITIEQALVVISAAREKAEKQGTFMGTLPLRVSGRTLRHSSAWKVPHWAV